MRVTRWAMLTGCRLPGMGAADRTRDVARMLLACIRLFNGLAGLFAPAMLARQLGLIQTRIPA